MIARRRIIFGALAFFSLQAHFPLQAYGQDQPPADCKLAEWLGPTLSLRPSIWLRNRDYDDRYGIAAGSLWLTLRPQEVAGISSFLEAYVQSAAIGRSGDSGAELREGYLQRSFGNLDVKVGRQIVVWGRADKINPTDNFTLRDASLLFTDDEEQRLGVLTTQVGWQFNAQHRLSLVLPHEWRTPTFPIKPDPNRQFSYADPDEPFLQGALKFSSEGGKVDWSLSYFNGYDKTPDIRRLAAGPPQQLELLFQRIQVVGGDFATVVGNYGWRGELAYTQTEDDAGDDPLTKNPFLFGVFGFDRNINEDVNWNLQLLVKQVFLHQAVSEATAFLQEPAKEEAIVSQQQEALQAGLSTRLNLQWLNDTLELELAGVLGFDLQSTVFKPKLSYAINDQLRGIVGGDLYTGPNESFFGRLGGISTAFAELRWTI